MTVYVSMALLWIGIVGWTYVGLFEDDRPLYRSSWLRLGGPDSPSSTSQMFCCALLRDSAGVPPVEGALYALNELLVGGESCCESCPGLAEVARIGDAVVGVGGSCWSSGSSEAS
jgi:hypothetical protein